MYKGNCFKNEPGSTYCDPTTKLCLDCKKGCNKCDQNLSCQECNKVMPYLYKGECLSSCPNYTYCDSISGICVDCPLNCL